MDILRVIKLKHFYGELKNLKPEEKLFFQLHENLHMNSYGDLCNENGEWIVEYDFKNDYFYYNYYRFYVVFKNKFNINSHDFNDLCKGILEKYLNCKVLTPFGSRSGHSRPLEKYLNCKVLTPVVCANPR